LAAILIATCALQVVFIVLLADPIGGGGPDSIEFQRHAMNLLDRGIYSYDGVAPDRMRQPLYPLFLAGVYRLFGTDNYFVYAIQVVIGTATVFLTWHLARRLGARGATALLAAFILACYPPFLRLSGMILTESVSTLLWVLTGCLFVSSATQPRLGSHLALGAAVGIHTLCRAATALLPIPLVLYFWHVWRSTRSAVVAGAIVATAFAVVVMPWGVRNYVTLGSPTVVSTEGGATFFFGTHADRDAIWAEGMWGFVQSDEMRSIIGNEYYISERADTLLRAAAWRQLAEQPVRTVLRGIVGAVKPWLYMPGGLTVSKARPWLWGPVISLPIVLLLLALYGVLTRRDPLTTITLLGFPAYVTAMMPLFLAHPRQVLPLFPFLAIGAAMGVERVISRQERHGPPAPAASDSVT